MEYEPVIGLEIHAQLATATKIFCGCKATYGGRPNTRTCPVCLGLPGALPVLNRSAVEFALRMILATGGEVQPTSVFARKNYFYPDLPKGYQISQYERPLGKGGKVRWREGDTEHAFRLTRIHLEEDAGKLLHDADASRVDLNRCGVPLIEIVTEPEIPTPESAARLLQALRQLLRYLAICDGNMEEGSLRCDANVSLRPVGRLRLGTKTELKNMNSFRAVERALRFEIARQQDLLARNLPVVHETLLWDEHAGRAVTMRGKEEALDYRYFPEPDLVPLRVDEEWLASVRRDLPELPAERCGRFVSQYEIPTYDAEVLTAERPLADYYEAVVRAHPAAKRVANWVMGEVLRYQRESGLDRERFPVSAKALAELLDLVADEAVSGSGAKEVMAHMVRTGQPARTALASLGLAQISDPVELSAVVERVLAKDPTRVREYLDGKRKLFAYFVGQVMQETGGQANPRVTNELLRNRLEGE